MSLYFLSYDLRKSRNYQPLYDELNDFDAVRVLESTWSFRRINTSAEGIRNHFRQYIDGDDGIIVSDVSAWASHRTDGTPKDLS